MLFQETSFFTRRIAEIMSDDEYGELQKFLIANPGSGVLIPGGGGIRKIRWSGSGRGKRGGTRIIYYWEVPDWLLMLFVYKKSDLENLPPEKLPMLRRMVEDWLNEKK